MKKSKLVWMVFLPFLATAQQDKPAYTLFSGNGIAVSYQAMIQDVAASDVVFIGEYHNNPIAHWMEIEIAKSLFDSRKDNLVLGAEMFESDTQLMLTEYLDSVISTTRFEADMRLWSNYQTDYKPLVEFARQNKVPFIATNIPRRYADAVNKTGGADVLNTLTEEAKRLIAPIPIPFKSDSILIREISRAGMMSSKNTLAIAKAQAVKDATMAWFIAKNLGEGKLFIHFNGSFHSDHFSGILYYLNIYKSNLKIRTLTTVEQANPKTLDEGYLNKADYILCVPETMTKTY